MPGKRDSLRVWLEKNLNANKIRGLEWKDKSKKIFMIRWKHASKHGWSSEVDGCVFREWAIYSGKFKPGEKGKQEPKVWKANFRCALNALPDIVENVAERETRGNDAQKVFQMKPHASKHGKRNRSSLRYSNTSSYQVSSCYSRHYKDSRVLLPQHKSAWSFGSSYVGQWPKRSQPPALSLDFSKEREQYFPKEDDHEPYVSFTRNINGNLTEPVLPEHRIIELIDDWTHELDNKREIKSTTSISSSNTLARHNDVYCPDSHREVIQLLRQKNNPHHCTTPVATTTSHQATCFATFSSHI